MTLTIFPLGKIQFKVVSDFCNDVAKGIMIAAVVGQGAMESLSGLSRGFLSLFWGFTSLFMLYFAILFSKEANYDRN